MTQFNYVAVDADGNVKKGTQESMSSDELATVLQKQGYSVVSITQKSSILNSDVLSLNIGKVPLKEKTLFLRQMAYMINAGLPITQSLEIMQHQTNNKQFQKILADVLKEVQDGGSLSKAFSRHPKAFDQVTVNLVKAGEESGKLDLIFERLADFGEKQTKLKSKIRGALIYPAVISAVMVGVIIFLIVYLVPTVKAIFQDLGSGDAELPFITQFFVWISDFIQGYWWLMLLIIAFLFVSYKYYVRTKAGRLAVDRFKLKIPIFGNLITKSELAQFAKTFAMLMHSGVPILDALNMVSKSLNNTAFKTVLAEINQKVEKGLSLSQAMSQYQIIPIIMAQMAATGEQTGKLDELIDKLGEYYTDEVDQLADNMTKLLEPIILLVMGGLAGLVAVAVYLPIFSINTAVK